MGRAVARGGDGALRLLALIGIVRAAGRQEGRGSIMRSARIRAVIPRGGVLAMVVNVPCYT